MDDRRFDSLTKAFAAGTSRRSLFKGLLGLGGAAAVGGTILEPSSEAARRPTPTPRPPICPGTQTPQGGQCVCISPPAPGPEKCGPDCCNPAGIGANHSECCDSGCCYGHCYGEELCCDYPLVFCEAQNECCEAGDNQCCGSTGCCDTACCPVADGSAACCEEPTPKCCPDDACIPAGGCCADAECPGCQSCIDHVCTPDRSNCPGGTAGCYDCVGSSCQKNAGYCNDGNGCTTDICNDDGTCSNPFYCTADSCCEDDNTCTQNFCNEETGVCSYPFYCTSDTCCIDNPNGPSCNIDNGQCYVPCADSGESCTEVACCDPAQRCYGIPQLGTVCADCIGNNVPCVDPAVCAVACCSGFFSASVLLPIPVCLSCAPLTFFCTNDSQCCGDFSVCALGVCVGF